MTDDQKKVVAQQKLILALEGAKSEALKERDEARAVARELMQVLVCDAGLVTDQMAGLEREHSWLREPDPE